MEERRVVSGTKGFWGVIGLVLGLLVPPLIVKYGHIETYILQAIILATITIVAGFLMLPGHREDLEMVEEYLQVTSLKPRKFTFSDLFAALKKKNFVLWLFLHFMYSILTGLLIASLNYFIKYNLMEESTALFIGMSGYILVSIFTIPLWIKVANKVNNNKKMVTIGAFSMAIATFSLFFANSLISLLILGCFIGLTSAIFFVMQDTINGDVLDECVIIDGNRLEATYLGIKFFIGRLANVVQFLVLVIVHILTGFVTVPADQPLSALFGIRLHMAVIPAIALLIGALVFWKWYDITPEKTKEIQSKIEELKL
jgi:Na+/melibiose symporter-like transporter